MNIAPNFLVTSESEIYFVDTGKILLLTFCHIKTAHRFRQNTPIHRKRRNDVQPGNMIMDASPKWKEFAGETSIKFSHLYCFSHDLNHIRL